MARTDLIMPKMGESIMEATILKWLKKEGENVGLDEPILEIATDKVDSEVPSPVEGVIGEHLFKEGDVVEVGKVIAYINTGSESESADSLLDENPKKELAESPVYANVKKHEISNNSHEKIVPVLSRNGQGGRFYSPLVLNIAKTEGIEMGELDAIAGTGRNNRLTKKDMLVFLKKKQSGDIIHEIKEPDTQLNKPIEYQQPVQNLNIGTGVEIIEMDRMRKLIAEHMVNSKKVSPHVTSFVEADVTNIVNWRNKIKEEFQKREGQKITFTPIFIEAMVKAIRDFPMVNVSLKDTQIYKYNNINVGMAVALPSGNLIVPVIKNTESKNLLGLTKDVNELSNKARNNKLKPDDIEGGTITLTNVGTFGNLMGTPIINQPQVAILATGAIKKKPVVVETETGDMIGIRHMMFLSLSYDHRVVDGSLGGAFLRRIADHLEQFNPEQNI